MTHPTSDASASTHPCVFTTRESGLIRKALKLIEAKSLRGRPILGGHEDFDAYLRLRFAGLSNEQGHVLYLNQSHELLAAETECHGQQRHLQWDMRRIVQRALGLGAECVVFAHNHPGDNPTPSAHDLQHLARAESLLQSLGIRVLDSYVVTVHGIASIREHRQHRAEMIEQQHRGDTRRLRHATRGGEAL